MKQSAVACVWIAQLALEQPTALARDIAPFRDPNTDDIDPRAIYAWAIDGLDGPARHALAALSLLPAGIGADDLAKILEAPTATVSIALDALRRRGFVIREADGVHTRHPFVRQFAPRVLADELVESQRRIDAWVGTELATHGGEWNWRGLRRLGSEWLNLAPTIHRCQTTEDDDAKRRYLALWHMVDYFLWSVGRWREKQEFALAAERVAERLGDRAAQAAALCAAAEVDWYLTDDRERIDANLARAKALFAEVGDRKGAALASYYRGRMLRKIGDPCAALVASSDGVEDARASADPLLIGLALNCLGNAHRDLEDWPAAQDAYTQADAEFVRAGEQELASLEMRAVVQRNLGRVALRLGRHGEAVVALEHAMSQFREVLHLLIEEAEAGMSHAEALAGLGEFEEAWEEIRAVEATTHRLCSIARADEVRKARSRIEVLCTVGGWTPPG